MKVIHLSSRDAGGGAFNAATRLHKSFLRHGVDSRMFVGRKLGADPQTYGPETQLGKLWYRVAPKIDKIALKLAGYPSAPYRSSGVIGSGIRRRLRDIEWDIVNLHWISEGFMTPKDVSLLSSKPVVWRLADMWPMTGTEHYVGESLRYKEGYQAANQGENQPFFDFDRWVWNRKLTAWKTIKSLTIVAPSRWMADCARESFVFKNRRIEVIPTGHDLEIFRKVDRVEARRKLGLPLYARLVLFGAAGSLTDRRKGFQHVGLALKSLADNAPTETFELVFFGNETPLMSEPVSGVKIHNLGVIEDAQQLSLVYAAADVFLAPSEEENLANTVIEAMASGTPVVAFNIGGMPDIVEHKVNGFLAQPYNRAELAAGLAWVTTGVERRRKLSANARKKVEASFSLNSQRNDFLTLYSDLL